MKMLALIAALSVAASVPQDAGMPRPGKEHETLQKQFEGEWTFEAKFFMDPAQPQEMTGTDSAKMGYGGFWITSEIRGAMFGQPFEGRWTMTYDPLKKKYVGSWIDSMMPILIVFEGEANPAGKVYTLIADSVDPATLKPVKERYVIEVVSDEVHTMKFFSAGPDGKERNTGLITYRRKK
ncbi:MAG TPA: DUF1579 domain-containing protein [Planctomycetota bacterium]|nr:DUF1579 domain-containing protein [Planctomycetota bacterium]